MRYSKGTITSSEPQFRQFGGIVPRTALPVVPPRAYARKDVPKQADDKEQESAGARATARAAGDGHDANDHQGKPDQLVKFELLAGLLDGRRGARLGIKVSHVGAPYALFSGPPAVYHP
jgi:hypothetical protein